MTPTLTPEDVAELRALLADNPQWDPTPGSIARALLDAAPALLALASLGREVDWRPIETAPYQQTVFVGQDCGPLLVTAFRMSPQSGWRHAHSADVICFEPTHWQPLPEPPGALAQQPAKCICERGNDRPYWTCPVHGYVVVDH